MAASSVSRSFAASIRSTNSIISSTAAFCTTCCGIWWRPRASIGSPRIEWRVIARLIMTLAAEGAKQTWSTGAGRIGMVRCCLAYAAAIVVYSAAAPYSFAQAEPRAVIELFTSQGCSSCPAADRLLGELAGDPSLVSVSVPVDYWDYLGWKDTLADPRNSARQKACARARRRSGLHAASGGERQPTRSRERQGGNRACDRRQSEERRDVVGTDACACRWAAQRHRSRRYRCAYPCGGVGVRAGQGRDRRDWARRKQGPRDHLPQRRAAVGQARRLDRQGQFVEHPGADAQGRQYRRSGGLGAERHGGKAEGDPRRHARGDPVIRRQTAMERACVLARLLARSSDEKRAGFKPARKSLGLNRTRNSYLSGPDPA